MLANPTNERPPTLQQLYPGLTEEQLKEAEQSLRLYLDLALRIYERVRNDPTEYRRFQALTEPLVTSKLDDDRRSEVQDTSSNS
jgi:hypothetical protein